jgi:hypothetical protein
MDMFEGVGRRSDQATGSFLSIGAHSLNGRERNVLFRNNRDGTYTDVGWVQGVDRVEDGRGLAVVDVDRDGRQDLVLRNYKQPAQLLVNRLPRRHWLDVALVGAGRNRDAIGAVVRLRTGDRWQTRVVAAGSTYLSQQSPVPHFGLGDAAVADELVVRWPSGAETRRTAVRAGQRLLLREDG